MPEIINWLSANPVRWVVPAILVVSVIGVPVAFLREKRRSSVPAHVAEMRAWRGLSTQEQAAIDAQAIKVAAFREHDAEVRAGAEQAARLAVERAARTNALYHP
jgi:hypothetical protein